MLGGPGKVSSLILRIAQCLFAIVSALAIGYATGFSRFTAFHWLFAAMGIQTLWSMILFCLDINALKLKKNLLQDHTLMRVLAVGDWVTALLSLAAASSSAAVVIALSKDMNLCVGDLQSACFMYQIAVGLAFIAWFLLALSSCVLFYLASSI